MHRKNAKRTCLPLLTVLALSLTGCATTSPPSVGNCPTLPMPPSVNTQTPQVSYSTSAREDIQNWRQRLTESITIDKR